jgi:DNA-binding CsgD family transcriptional regulator
MLRSFAVEISEGHSARAIEARYTSLSRPGWGFPDPHPAPPDRSRRAVAFGTVVHRPEEAALADALDGITAGFFLVDSMRRTVHANASGRAMLAKGDIVHTIGERLTPRDCQARKTFNRVFAAPHGGPASPRGAAVPLPTPDGELWMAHVMPLAVGNRRLAGIGYSATAAVFVRRAALDLASPLETLAETYRLTPAETRVLAAVIDGGGVPEASRALGVSETTVKTHLRHVFDKTGTKRQAELVKLAAGFANPFGL